MSFQPILFIDISKELESGKSEAHFRSVVNRAYYGAFGYLKDSLSIMEISQSIHRDLIRSLKESPRINEKKAGFRLEGLFKKRTDADYNYRIKFDKNLSSFSINEAERIIELFNQPAEE